MLILIIPFATADYFDYNNQSYLEMDFSFETNLHLYPTGSNMEVESIEVTVQTYPRESSLQEITESKYLTTPNAQKHKERGELIFTWQEPEATDYNIKLTSKIISHNSIANITQSIPFPLEDSAHSLYTLPTSHIDVDQKIRAKAQEIAENQSDLYHVTFELADWVNKNIAYNKSSTNVESIKTSTWVLENKEGVCDEVTNLFTSLVRSLDIPVKFITGLAYSNLEETWSPHAWSEVYFPGHGWIPFDVTYGQYGWIDPTHIKLSETADSGVPTTSYQWKARNADLEFEEATLSAKISETGETIPKLVAIKVNPIITQAGPGSYIPLEVIIKNGQGIYLPESIILTRAPEILGENYKRVLLEPYEVKKLYWILKAPEGLERGFTYTSEIRAEDTFHSTGSSEIIFASNYDVYSLEEARALINNETGDFKEEQKAFTFDCTSPTYVYNYESAKVFCQIKNNLEKTLDKLKVCSSDLCEELDIEDKENVTIELTPNKEGLASYVLRAIYNGETQQETETFNVLTSPGLRIVDLEAPLVVDYEHESNLSFMAVVEAPIIDVNIFVNGKQVLDFEELNSSKQFKIHFLAEDTYPEEKVSVMISYKDENGQEYKSSKEKEIKITNAPAFYRLLNWLGLI